MKRKKVFIVIPSMTCGGSERVVSIILKFLDRKAIVPCLITYGGKSYYEIPSDVKIIELDGCRIGGPLRGALNFFKRTKELQRIIDEEKPDSILGVLAGPIPLMAGKRSKRKPKVVIRESSFPSKDLVGFKGWIYRIMIRRYYPKADLLVTMTNDAKKDLVDNFGIDPGKIEVIPNPIDLAGIGKLSKEAIGKDESDDKLFRGDAPVIISAGRLIESKGYRYLIRAFGRLSKGMKARLVILGKGGQRYELQKIAKDAGVGDSVFLIGERKNPFKYFRRAAVFAFPSLYEGFPNVVTESMACGTATISTDCQSGPRDIIEHGKSGLLVPTEDEGALYEAMKRLLSDEKLRKSIAKNGRIRVKDFDARKIVKRYAEILK